MDMERSAIVSRHEHPVCCHRVSWSAIIVAAFVGLGISFLINLFSVAIGLTAFTTSANGMITLAVGGMIGLLIGVIASMFVTGWIAGYLGRPMAETPWYGILHGFAAWSLALILAMVITPYVSVYLMGVASSIERPVISAVQTTAAESHAALKSATNKPGNTAAENKAKELGVGAGVLFVLFFVGAFSASFGGYAGYGCRRDECSKRNIL